MWSLDQEQFFPDEYLVLLMDRMNKTFQVKREKFGFCLCLSKETVQQMHTGIQVHQR